MKGIKCSGRTTIYTHTFSGKLTPDPTRISNSSNLKIQIVHETATTAPAPAPASSSTKACLPTLSQPSSLPAWKAQPPTKTTTAPAPAASSIKADTTPSQPASTPVWTAKPQTPSIRKTPIAPQTAVPLGVSCSKAVTTTQKTAMGAQLPNVVVKMTGSGKRRTLR